MPLVSLLVSHPILALMILGLIAVLCVGLWVEERAERREACPPPRVRRRAASR
jgi:hypothetical protein